MISMTPNFQDAETKRRSPQKAKRHKAQKFIEPVRKALREAFRNTEDTEQVAAYFEATPRSVSDVVISGHGAQIDEYGQRLAAIESRLGIRKPLVRENGLRLVQRSGAA